MDEGHPKSILRATKEFAAHPLEEGYARKILIAALHNDIGYKDYCESIRAWMKAELRDQNDKPLPLKHINKQIKKLMSVETYFSNEQSQQEGK